MLSATTTQRHLAILRHVLGPAASLLDDPRTTEVLINPDGTLWQECQGEALHPTGDVFLPVATMQVIAAIAGATGKSCTAHQPTLRAMLPGTRVRVQATLPPASKGPSCTFRRLSERILTLDDQIAAGVVEPWQADCLRQAVHAKHNLILAGQTGSGKTTMQGSLLDLIDGERLVTVEDTEELLIRPGRDWKPLYTTETLSIHAQLIAALRERPDRVMIGEVRGAEMADMLDSWESAHPGGISTLHASTPESALRRMEGCLRQVSPAHPVPMAGKQARPLLAANVQWIVCMARTPLGRRVTAIARLHGMHGKQVHWTAVTQENYPCHLV
jgi:Flp pilus assembly CpaF family ATPase